MGALGRDTTSSCFWKPRKEGFRWWWQGEVIRAVSSTGNPQVSSEGDTVWGVYQIRAKSRVCPAHSAPMGSLISSVPRNAAERLPIKLVPVRSGGHPDCVWLTKEERINTSLIRHTGINDVNLCRTGLIPERPFRVCPCYPIKPGKRASFFQTITEPSFPVPVFRVLPVSGSFWTGLELWGHSHPLILWMLLLQEVSWFYLFCEILWILNPVQDRTNHQGLSIVCSELWSSCYCSSSYAGTFLIELLLSPEETFRRLSETFTYWQSKFLVSFPGR